MDSPKQQAEELSNQFQGLGAESMAIGAQGLKDGVEQSQAMIPPVITQLEQLITSAQSMKNSGLTTQTPDVRPPPTPLDAAPTHLREPTAKIGDPTTAPTPQPGALRAELADSDDHDRNLSTARRLGRGLVRRASSIQDSAKDTAKSVASMVENDFDPYDYGQAQATVGVANASPPTVSGPEVKVTDTAGTAVIAAVVLVEGFTRIAGRFGRKNG